MSAQEIMNMARVRAEQAEARAERAEAALRDVHERAVFHAACICDDSERNGGGIDAYRDIAERIEWSGFDWPIDWTHAHVTHGFGRAS